MAKTVVNDLLQIFRSSVSAVLPDKLIKNTVKFNSSIDQMTIAGVNYDLKRRNVYLVGTGKAVQHMAREVEVILGTKIKQGIISIPVGSLDAKIGNNNVIYCEGAKNNLPDKDAERTAHNVRNLVTNLNKDDILLVLISGGGSALLPLPKEPIALEEKTQLIKKLANSGADITELNTVRKRLSDIKGGQLAMKAQPATVISLILSDIVGDPLDLIASGLTTENSDDYLAAINVIKKYNLYDELPNSIRTVLEDNNNNVAFPKNNVKNNIIGSNKISINEAKIEAERINYLPIVLSNIVTGNVKHIAKQYVKLSKAFCDYIGGSIDKTTFRAIVGASNVPGVYENIVDLVDRNIGNKGICLILGGEITVEVKGTGKGGRNQQLALEFSNIMNETKEEFKSFDVHFLSAGTDGIDGPTDAAGAIGYLNLITDSKEDNLNVDEYLYNNDSYNFYRAFKDGKLHVITGHTNTNVMDIHLIIIKKYNKSLKSSL